MDVTVIGAGALGTYLAVRTGATRLVVHEARKGQLQRHGLKLKGAETRAARPTVLAWDDFGPLAGPVLVTVKANDLAATLVALKPRVTARSPVILCQGGLSIFEAASAVLPAEVLVRAACWLAVSSESPGVVQVAGAPRIELAGRRTREILPLFGTLPVRDVQDVGVCEWRKALFNAGIDGACTLAGVPHGTLLESVALQRVTDRLLAEGAAVAAAEGVALGEKDFESVYESAKGTASHAPAMLQEIRDGKPTEIGWINGAVSRIGRKRKIATPCNDLVTDLITCLEERSVRKPVLVPPKAT